MSFRAFLFFAGARFGERFFAASKSPTLKVRIRELKKIKKKWKILKLGLDTGGVCYDRHTKERTFL